MHRRPSATLGTHVLYTARWHDAWSPWTAKPTTRGRGAGKGPQPCILAEDISEGDTVPSPPSHHTTHSCGLALWPLPIHMTDKWPIASSNTWWFSAGKKLCCAWTWGFWQLPVLPTLLCLAVLYSLEPAERLITRYVFVPIYPLLPCTMIQVVWGVCWGSRVPGEDAGWSAWSPPAPSLLPQKTGIQAGKGDVQAVLQRTQRSLFCDHTKDIKNPAPLRLLGVFPLEFQCLDLTLFREGQLAIR